MDFKDKVVVVTGGSTGIGAAVASRFAEEGAKVVIIYQSNVKAANQVVDHLFTALHTPDTIQCNVTQECQVANLFEKIKNSYGKIDVLINNVGRTYPVSFDSLTQESLEQDFSVNLISMMLCSKYASKLMGSGGAIINTASIRGMLDCGRPGIMGYCAAKAGVSSFTKNLALKLAPHITVNAVAPGFVETDYMKATICQRQREQWCSDTPNKAFVGLEELSSAYVFLAKTRAITGVILPVDGGYTLLNR